MPTALKIPIFAVKHALRHLLQLRVQGNSATTNQIFSRGGDRGDPRDRCQENALGKQENGQEESPTRVTGGLESRDGVSRGDTEPENHIKDTDDREGESSTTSKVSTHAEWEARSAKENLDMLGWARTFASSEVAESTESYLP